MQSLADATLAVIVQWLCDEHLHAGRVLLFVCSGEKPVRGIVLGRKQFALDPALPMIGFVPSRDRRKTYLKKSWLMSVAQRVKTQSLRYATQLKACP